MHWTEIRASHPDQWLIIEALEARTNDHRRSLDRIAVIEQCTDGATALQRYREIHREHPERELYFVHTRNEDLEIDERPWIGIRRNDAANAAE